MATATERAFDIIRSKILSGAFAPGAHLKENELVTLCGVSRTPVRDALRQLVADRYVINRPNIGTYVNSWSKDELLDMFELRARLEGYGAKRAAHRWLPQHMTALKASYEAILASLETGGVDVDTYLRENQRFHRTLLDAADSAPLRQQISGLVLPPIVARTALSYSLDELKRSNDHHRELLEALDARDGDWAEAVMRGHILAAKRKFFLRYTGDT